MNVSGSGKAFGVFSRSKTPFSYLTEPPDLSQLDGHAVVSFKSLQKSNETTKTKALEELIAYARARPYENEGVDDLVLVAWIGQYPRASIDNSRRIRELSHTLQNELMKSARRRMEKYLSAWVGPLLAGTLDRDKLVSHTASDCLAVMLKTPEKTAYLWKTSQKFLLQYVTDAMHETPESLSDTRNTTEADAAAKYHRLVGMALAIILKLMEYMDAMMDPLQELLAGGSLWEHMASQEPHSRSTVYAILNTCLVQCPVLVQPLLPRICKGLFTEALKCNQMGSAADLVAVLKSLTERFPQVWGTKQHPWERMLPIVKQGSLGGPEKFWDDLAALLMCPSMPMPPPTEAASRALGAVRKGLSSRQEPRNNWTQAWMCHAKLFAYLVDCLPAIDDTFMKVNFYDLIRQHLHCKQDQSVHFQPEAKVLLSCWGAIIRRQELGASAQGEWTFLADNFATRMTSSLPAVSADYENSQRAVAFEGERWFRLMSEIFGPKKTFIQHFSDHETAALKTMASAASMRIIEAALHLLKRRNYKPIGVAKVMQDAIALCPELFQSSPGKELLTTLLPIHDAPALAEILQCESANYILAWTNAIGDMPWATDQYLTIWKVIVDSALALPSHSCPSILLPIVTHSHGVQLARRHEVLQDYIVSGCEKTSRDDQDFWDFFASVLSADMLNEKQMTVLSSAMLRNLQGRGPEAKSALRVLELIFKKKPSILKDKFGVQIAAALLALTELDGEVSALAQATRKFLQVHGVETPLVSIIRMNLESADESSLTIETLATQALAAPEILESVFPSISVWKDELSIFLERAPNPSLTLTNSLGGAYFLVQGTSAWSKDIRRDRAGASIPARMASYVCRLMMAARKVNLNLQAQLELFHILCLTEEMAADQLNVEEDGLWAGSEENWDTIRDFLFLVRRVMLSMMKNEPSWADDSLGEETLVRKLIKLLSDNSASLSPTALYSAKALSRLFQDLTESHAYPRACVETRFKNLKILKATPQTIFPAIAFITGFGETLVLSRTVRHLCNRLVSDIAGAFPSSANTLLTMILLSSCMSVYETVDLPVDGRRQVLAMKQMTTWTDTPDEMGNALATVTCSSLQRLLANVMKMYGPYWEQTIKFCLWLWRQKSKGDRWEDEARLPALHASLRLMSTMETLTGMSSNDDLVESMAAHAGQINQALLELLKAPRLKNNAVMRIVDGVLCRRAGKIPGAQLGHLPELYGLLASKSEVVQMTAFGLLRGAIPQTQLKLTVDVLLEKRNGHLPDELLSLLLDAPALGAPALGAFPESVFVKFLVPIRRYLFAWLLVFDTYTHSSEKLRQDFSEDLKVESCLPLLLEFMFDVLGHTVADPLNLERANLSDPNKIRKWDPRLAGGEIDELSIQWLLVHLFYLTLHYLPGLFRPWFLNQRSKQTKIAIEDWTKRYFSKLIIEDALEEVDYWIACQPPTGDDERKLTVQVSRPGRKVTVAYKVEEDEARLLIQLPDTFPLEPVKCESITRIVVSEKKWQSWLRTIEGVITFSNGRIVDGLIAFKRNIAGALKGQTECAICYSIVSSDKKTSDKKCGTCKNTFHNVCLYKWFQTSNQNSCPLCRNSIDIVGAARRGKVSRR